MKSNICPRCNKHYTHPALSRRDNLTNICPACRLSEVIYDHLTAKNVNPGSETIKAEKRMQEYIAKRE